MKYYSTLLLFMLIVSLRCQAQFVSHQATESSILEDGKRIEITLVFQVKAGYHIQADQRQIDNEFLIPTSLRIRPNRDLKICSIDFPSPNTISFAGENEIPVFEDHIMVKIIAEKLNATTDIQKELSGTLHYQACDESKCFWPRTLAFTMK